MVVVLMRCLAQVPNPPLSLLSCMKHMFESSRWSRRPSQRQMRSVVVWSVICKAATSAGFAPARPPAACCMLPACDPPEWWLPVEHTRSLIACLMLIGRLINTHAAAFGSLLGCGALHMVLVGGDFESVCDCTLLLVVLMLLRPRS